MTTVEEIEKRFLEITGLNSDLDLSVFPLQVNTPSQPKTDKDRSKEHGEVFTPLWLVDQMILKATVEKLHQAKSTLDLCAGYGQFTVRMIRALANYDPKFDVNSWLKNNHTLIERQTETCHKILYIFGTDINLFMGDATKFNSSEFKKSLMKKHKGIFYYRGYWEDISIWVKKNMHPNIETFMEVFFEKLTQVEKKADTIP